jgi:hypothetical protein
MAPNEGPGSHFWASWLGSDHREPSEGSKCKGFSWILITCLRIYKEFLKLLTKLNRFRFQKQRWNVQAQPALNSVDWRCLKMLKLKPAQPSIPSSKGSFWPFYVLIPKLGASGSPIWAKSEPLGARLEPNPFPGVEKAAQPFFTRKVSF